MLQPDISPPATIQPLTRILPAIALVVVGARSNDFSRFLTQPTCD
jgi:hypothetical protein